MLEKRFKITLKLSNNDINISNNDINKLILLLRKDVYPYEYMDEQKSLMKHYSLKKNNFIAT